MKYTDNIYELIDRIEGVAYGSNDKKTIINKAKELLKNYDGKAIITRENNLKQFILKEKRGCAI